MEAEQATGGAGTPQEESAEDVRKREREELDAFVKELEQKIEARTRLREENLKCVRPAEEYFSRLDSNLKKNTAFVKKLKQFTAAQLPALQKDMSGLNLTKYISEICAALSEAKLKMTDVSAVVTLCSKLYQIYSEFGTQFLEAWQKILSIKVGEKISNPSKLRVDLRLFAELVSAGVITTKQGLSLLGNALMNIISQDKEDHSNFPIILSFCRHCGEEYAGLIPKHILDLAEKYNVTLKRSNFLPADKQQNLRTLLKDYFKTLCTHVRSEHAELLSMTRNVRKTMESKGEVSNEKREKCELMQANFDKLLTSAKTLSDLLAEPLPELPTDNEGRTDGIVLDNLEDDSGLNDLDPWGDEETKSFYVDLPDLRQFLPNFFAPKQSSTPPEEPPMTEEALDMDIDPEQLDVDDPPSSSSDPPAPEQPEPAEPAEEPSQSALPTQGPANILNTKQYFEQFLQNLNNCVNKELIDSVAIDFLLNLNTKNNRKKLAKSIFGVQRTRLDLLPFLSRFVAIINLVSQDVAFELAQMLKVEFKWHIKKKNQMNIESKIKVVRFIGELVKFGLYPKIEALFCLKILLHDFQHHQIEMACALFEVAGRYLYNCRDTRLRTNVYLEQMMRLKTATALDSRHTAQIESCYYLVKPPETAATVKKVRPPLHEYIRHLVFEELCKANVDKSIKLMRRLNWNDPEVSSYACKCLSKAYLLRFPLIRCLADLMSGLSSYQEKAVTRVIDTVFEDIRAGLEIHSPKLAQRRVAMAKYLGELYNYRLVESGNVLNTLYSIISLGVSTEEGVISPLDPPDSLFRLKLACVLLDTCGQYFTSALSRKRLDYFLVFFQHYYWYKKSNPIFSKERTSDLFPILIDHMYRDCLANVRPKLKQFKSYEQAKEAIEKLKTELYPQLLQPESAAGENEENEEEDKLQTVAEETEGEGEAEGEDVTEDTLSEAVNESDDEVRGEDEDDNFDAVVESSEEDEDLMKKREKTREDLEFEQMFEEMAQESYQERLRESVKPNTKDIPVPMMMKSSKKTYEQIQEGNNSPTSETSVPFVLMLRGSKGGKQQFKTFKAPLDSELAVQLKLQEQKIREENERVKRLTLNITERIEEEDYQESLLQSQKQQAQGRQQRTIRTTKFRHQKGAPDADLIFN